MSHDHSDMDKHIKRPLMAIGALVVLSLIGVTIVTVTDAEHLAALPDSTVVASRMLTFDDLPDGRVQVFDAATGESIEILAVGEYGFLRSTLRGLARERRSHKLGKELPFIIEKRSNGQILLQDTATQRYIDLWAFGETNARVFARYLDHPLPAIAGTVKEQSL